MRVCILMHMCVCMYVHVCVCVCVCVLVYLYYGLVPPKNKSCWNTADVNKLLGCWKGEKLISKLIELLTYFKSSDLPHGFLSQRDKWKTLQDMHTETFTGTTAELYKETDKHRQQRKADMSVDKRNEWKKWERWDLGKAMM